MKKLKFWKTAKNKASRKEKDIDGVASYLDSEQDFDEYQKERRFNGSESVLIS